MKNRVLTFVALLLVLQTLLCCCAPQDMKVKVKKYPDGSTYEVKNGKEEKAFTVADGEKMIISVAVTVTDGELDITIFKTDDQSVTPYKGNDMQTASFFVTVSVAGEYTILIEAKAFVGDYSFQYRVE